MKKVIKMIIMAIVSVILLIVIVGIAFLNLSPQFGGSHSSQDLSRYEDSGHYEDGKFVNLIPTSIDYGFANMKRMLSDYIKGNPNTNPKLELPMSFIDSMEIVNNKADRLVWFGHSAFLLQLDSKNILIDPMLGESPAPHPMIGTKRYNSELPIEIEKLPQIDAVLISHDHYDHLDYGSIKKLKDKTKMFYVPLGVAAHLKAWGIDENKIQEHNWWDENKLDKIKLAFTPARHFSGRGLADNSSTMWGSWVIKGENKNIYFSGDSGYGPHFKEIGEKYGPFDFAMMECGQYNENWSQIHMMPEETAQASVDVKTKMMMPIHWGAFTLALHDWNDPAIKVMKKANELNMPITIPEMGTSIELNELIKSTNVWW